MDAELTSMVRQLRGLEPDKWQRGLSVLMHGAAGKLEEQQAEIERLRGQLVVAHAETSEWIKQYNDCEKPDERDAEIDRLREIITQLQDEREAVIKVCVEKETERLRSLICAALNGEAGEWRDGEWVPLSAGWVLQAREVLGDE